MDALINNVKREDYEKIKRDKDVAFASLHFMMNYNISNLKRMGALKRNIITMGCNDFIFIDILSDEDVINDDAFKNISFENLKKNAITSCKREFFPILQGL